MSSSSVEYRKKEIPSKIQTIGLSLLAAGVIIMILGYLTDPVRTAYNLSLIHI